jgi:hypothetical protein
MKKRVKLTDLGPVTFRWGERETSPLSLIDDWAGHVLRLRSDALDPPAIDKSWGMHDLVAALYIRDAVERSLTAVFDEEHQRVPFALESADELFRTFTFEDVRIPDLIRKIEDESTEHRGWWWLRVPESGPVFEDLLPFGLDEIVGKR